MAGKKKTAAGPGAALRRVRKTARLTLEAAALQAGVTKGYLSKVESGQSTPSVRVIINLCGVYGIPVADILMPDDQRKPISIVRPGERTGIAGTAPMPAMFSSSQPGRSSIRAPRYFS